MSLNLELALKAIEEIEDIQAWESEFVNIINDYTLQAELNLSQTYSSFVSEVEKQNFKEDYLSVIQKVCISKLKDYRETIQIQAEALNIKNSEIIGLEENNRHLNEINSAISAMAEDLKVYLDKADSMNTELQKDNLSLKDRVRSLEFSISSIEYKSQQLTMQMVSEESQSHQTAVDELQAVILKQNETIKNLQEEVEGYNFLKIKYEKLEKEAVVVDQLRKEIVKQEETISELNKDYQSLLIEFSQRACGTCLARGTITAGTIYNRSGNSTNTSRNNVESDEEILNKNSLVDKDHFSNTPERQQNTHHTVNSLMEEVMSLKLHRTPLSISEINALAKPKLFHTAKPHSKKHSALVDSSFRTNKRLFFSQSFKPSTLFRSESEEPSEQRTPGSVIELTPEDLCARKSIEIIASELNSEAEIDGCDNDRKHSATSADKAVVDNLLEDENILMGWEEQDFPRLGSTNSVDSQQRKRASYGHNELLEKLITDKDYHLPRRSSIFANMSQRSHGDNHEGNMTMSARNLRTVEIGDLKTRGRQNSAGVVVVKLEPLYKDEHVDNVVQSQPHVELDYIQETEFSTERSQSSKQEIVDEVPKEVSHKTEEIVPKKELSNASEHKEIRIEETIVVPETRKLVSDKEVQATIDDAPVEQVEVEKVIVKKPEKEKKKIELNTLDQNNLVVSNIQSQVSTTVSASNKEINNFVFSDQALGYSSLLSVSTLATSKVLQKSLCGQGNAHKRRINENENNTKDKGIINSMALTALPMLAGASLTYLFMRK